MSGWTKRMVKEEEKKIEKNNAQILNGYAFLACIFLTSHACRTLYTHTFIHTYIHSLKTVEILRKKRKKKREKTTATRTFCKLHKIIFYECTLYSYKCVVICDSESQNMKKKKKLGEGQKKRYIYFRHRFFYKRLYSMKFYIRYA